MSDIEAIHEALQRVAAAGLNVQAVMHSRRVTHVLEGLDVASWPTLLLFGSTGSALWDALTAANWLERPDPVDSWCGTRLASLRDSLPCRGVFVFPSRAPVDVVALGRAAGWAHPTPLGLGMHPEHGLWVGYRGALLLDTSLPERGVIAAPSPCEECRDTPCVTECLGQAVEPGGLLIDTCFTQRLAPSPCATRCASRLACPVGAEHRYSDPQIAHHQASGNRLYRAHVASGGLPITR
ncbi:MAG: hypothetical protein KDA24_25530 [Deltaproteobacteria bacterium]|nr:hypothetical protein [Deltaproteobacteria bacterium]